MNGVLGHDSALQDHTGPGTTWANGFPLKNAAAITVNTYLGDTKNPQFFMLFYFIQH